MAQPLDEHVVVGRVKDAHGLKGELFIVLYSGEAAWLRRLKTLRLRAPAAQGGELVEAGVRAARLHKNGLIALSPDVRGRNEAEKLKGYELEVPSEFFVSEPGETIYLREIAGFEVWNAAGGGEEIAGRIVAFSSNGAQDLIVVRTQSGDFPVPLAAPLVRRIDYEGKRIFMEIPEGLLGDEEGSDDEGEDAVESDSLGRDE